MFHRPWGPQVNWDYNYKYKAVCVRKPWTWTQARRQVSATHRRPCCLTACPQAACAGLLDHKHLLSNDKWQALFWELGRQKQGKAVCNTLGDRAGEKKSIVACIG